MKLTRFLMALLIVLPFLQSCQDDITDLADPRDAITKKWEIDETQQGGQSGYWVTISKDPNEKTRVLFDNFHNLKSSDIFYATLAGMNLDIPSQTLDGTYTIEGDGTIANDLQSITFNYTVDAGDGPETINSIFGQVNVTKKKKVKVTVPLQ